MKQFAEIEYLDLKQNIEYEEIIQEVLMECFKEEKLENTNLYISITLTNPENIQKLNGEYVTEVTAVDPFMDIKKKPKRLTKKIRRTLSDEEINRLVDFLSKENPCYLAACLLCYCCFLRPKEICSLFWRDIDLEKQVIRVDEEIAKNDNISYRTIPDVILPYLRQLNSLRSDWYVFSDPHTFSSGSKKMCSREIARFWNDVVRPGCEFSMDLQFYSLKDTGISNMAESGIPLTFVQQQADHSSVAVTEIYISHSKCRAQEELKEVDILTYRG